MDAIEIKTKIDNDRERQRKNSEWRRYAGGMNPGIYADAPKDDPDNRIPVPFARKAVKTVKGYMFRAGDVVYSGDDLEKTYAPVFEANNESLLTGSEAESAMIYGKSFELHWMDMATKELFFAEVPIDQCIPIYDDTLLQRLIGFIRYYYPSDNEYKAKFSANSDIADAPPLRNGPVVAYYYDDKMITEYTAAGAGDAFVQGESKAHGYAGIVPVVEYNIDLRKNNLFNHAIPLIDLYDKLASEDLADELARFASAYLLLSDQIDNITLDENGRTELDRIKSSKAFTQLGDDVAKKVAFLTKDVNGVFIKESMDRFERLIHDMLGIPDTRDIVGATDTSGIAMRFKLWPFECLCAEIESVFKIGLMRRLKVLAFGLKMIGNAPKEDKLEITFKRNLPSNMTEMADIALKLAGIISKKSQLRLLSPSIIPDVKKELEDLAEEEKFDFVADSGMPDEKPVSKSMGKEDSAPEDIED